MKLDFMKILRVSLMKAGGDRGEPKSILTESSDGSITDPSHW